VDEALDAVTQLQEGFPKLLGLEDVSAHIDAVLLAVEACEAGSYSVSLCLYAVTV
jgi:hypothetical protein